MSSENKTKLKLNITIKKPSRKQVIVFMNLKNIKNFMKDSSAYITNINRALKNIKLDIIADFVQLDNKEVNITTNKVVSTFNLQIIERYMKNVNNIESN